LKSSTANTDASKQGTAIVDVAISLGSNIKFLLAFGLNQAGSALFYAALANQDLSLAYPLTNAVATLFTTLMSAALGDQRLTARGIAGLSLIMLGSWLCMSSSDR